MLLSKNLLLLPALILSLTACGDKTKEAPTEQGAPASTTQADHSAEDHSDKDHSHDEDYSAGDYSVEDHSDKEVSIGTVEIGGAQVALAQGHGIMKAGAESHLVVKLPTSDAGATFVRAWIGTSDRTLSMVVKGTYAASHDDYDMHVYAPSPLPAGVQWWVEIEKPDGSKAVGSANPILK